uniref:Uncharacterized protein n=1 Tax=Brassica campestris TaxID=3711 RepID=A0A3P6CEY3_BRACM|nr:unnamed protein product [Brassica rapa]
MEKNTCWGSNKILNSHRNFASRSSCGICLSSLCPHHLNFLHFLRSKSLVPQR